VREAARRTPANGQADQYFRLKAVLERLWDERSISRTRTELDDRSQIFLACDINQVVRNYQVLKTDTG